ncbi:MAG: T9SS type A sorting domain-containing protein [candidate division Zixibacteria bacterium]|nr:T9SS type A sorting domain-containing protein [candidate division Zixibacteria bacterium]
MMVTTTTNYDSRDSHPALQRAGCDTRDHAKGVITLRNTILRLTRGAVFTGIALLLGITPALGQVAGNVTALDGSPLDGAVIEVWDSYPDGNLLDQTTSVLGDFSLADPGVSEFDLRTRATDYYPTVVRGLPNGTENTRVKLVLAPPKPTGLVLQPNDWWGTSTEFLTALIRPGDVISVYDPGGVVVGVSEDIESPGQYLMHGFPNDPTTDPDDGGDNGEALDFMINGLSAGPDAVWPTGLSSQYELTSTLDYPGATVTAPAVIGGVAGDAVRIEFLVENTGNITESFDVSVAIDENWSFTLPKALIGPLNPGESEIVEVFVDIPLNATGGFATAVVHAVAETYTPANSGAETQIDVNPTDVNDDDGYGATVPNSFSLAQNFPNPFNPETQIKFHLAAPGHVRLEVFNIIGQSVAVLVDGYRETGESIVEWDARNSRGENVASGVYFYRLSRNGDALTRKMVLMR